MILFLTSSPTGPLDNSRLVQGLDSMNQFRENLRNYWQGPKRCLMIAAMPEAHGENDQMMDFFYHAVTGSGFEVTAFDLWDSRTQGPTKEMLHSYDVIWLGGGHVPTQNRYFQKIGLREMLEDYEGIVIGISAGTMNCAEVVYAQPEEPGESCDPNYQRFLPGLGLTQTNILPHFQMVRQMWLDGRRIIEDITFEDSYGYRFLALCDGSYVLRENGRETIFGEHYYIENGSWGRSF